MSEAKEHQCKQASTCRGDSALKTMEGTHANTLTSDSVLQNQETISVCGLSHPACDYSDSLGKLIHPPSRTD